MRVSWRFRAMVVYLCIIVSAIFILATFFLLPLSSLKLQSTIMADIRHTALQPMSDFNDNPRHSILNFIHPEMSLLEKNVSQHMDESGKPPVPMSLPLKSDLQDMSRSELSDLYHLYTSTVQLSCSAVHRVGKVTDGGWNVCEDPPYRPFRPCIVYSFGIGGDFSFDDAAAKRYGCRVYSFDPSMALSDHKRDSGVQFYSLGLANFTGTSPLGWSMSTLDDVRQRLGHRETPIAVLKMDIEEWEWSVLPHILRPDGNTGTRPINAVTQLLMELHQCDGCSSFDPAQSDKEPPAERYLLAIRALYDLHDLGFRIFWNHGNPACRYTSRFAFRERTACREIGMVRAAAVEPRRPNLHAILT